MRFSISMLILLLVLPIPAGARSRKAPSNNEAVCVPTTRLDRQYRTAMKHRLPVNAEPVEITPRDMLLWNSPTRDKRIRRQDSPLGLEERTVYTLEADLWKVKLSKDDCDYHMELSMPGDPADMDQRIIAEVPNGAAFEAARKVVRPYAGREDLARPVRVRITGFGFYDGTHFSKSDPRKGKGHGSHHVATLWELHPVWKVEIL
jgi:hypothetical protein